MADAEGVIGELKNQQALDRVPARGTPLFHVQLLLSCTALNCKRIADHLPEAASGVAAAPAADANDLQPAAAAGRRADLKSGTHVVHRLADLERLTTPDA
jgi:hypothetical protein